MHGAGHAGKPGLGIRRSEREGDHACGEAVPVAIPGDGGVDLRPHPGVEEPLLDGGLIRTDPRSSGGRSAVSSSSGTPEWKASIVAGRRFATAVPLVHTTATGTRVSWRCPGR